MLIATFAMVLLAGCSKNSDVYIETEPDPDAPVEITFGAKQAELKTDVKTRGIGGIGGLDAENGWNGETLYIYALCNNPLVTDIPTNEKATAPAAATPSTVTDAITWADADKHFYYDGSSIYTFYGYHIDDATTDGASPVPTGDATIGYSVPFKIDGTQDLMVAATDRTKDIEDSSSPKKGELTGREDNLYSAWSARRDVTPNLVFKHLLSRLKFTVIKGNADAKNDGVAITKIEVYSASEGTLVVVPSADGATPQGLKDVTLLPDDLTTATALVLKQKPTTGNDKNLIDLEKVTATDTDQAVGESMLVIPADSYQIIIHTSQTIGGTAQTAVIPWKITPPTGATPATFGAGKIYTIAIKVYGLEEINVNATLTAWENGGSITVDPDDEPNPTPAPQP